MILGNLTIRRNYQLLLLLPLAFQSGRAQDTVKVFNYKITYGTPNAQSSRPGVFYDQNSRVLISVGNCALYPAPNSTLVQQWQQDVLAGNPGAVASAQQALNANGTDVYTKEKVEKLLQAQHEDIEKLRGLVSQLQASRTEFEQAIIRRFDSLPADLLNTDAFKSFRNELLKEIQQTPKQESPK